MTAGSEDREAEIDRLYGLPLAEFTPARDAIVKRLRSEKDREGAEQIKRLRKPTVSAWALNQVQRQDPEATRQLLAAGQRLRSGQERLLASGDRQPLAEATAEERRLVTDLAARAERALLAAGQPASAAVQSRLRATLHAVAGDPQARELIAAGRLVGDYELSDLGLGVWPAVAPPPAARPRAAGDEAHARRVRSARERLEGARTRRAELETKLDDARAAVEAARREAARATAALERAEAGAERADREAQETARHVAELEATLRKLEDSRAQG
jgi:hypothetical protein